MVDSLGKIFFSPRWSKERSIPILSIFLRSLNYKVSGVERVLTPQCDDYNSEKDEDNFKELVKNWNKQNDEAMKYCSCCYNCRLKSSFSGKRKCRRDKNAYGTKGSRMVKKYILSGLVLHLWDVIEDIKKTSRAHMTFANEYGYSDNEGLDENGSSDNNNHSLGRRTRKNSAPSRKRVSSTTTTSAITNTEEEDYPNGDNEKFEDMGVVKAKTDTGRSICGLEIHPNDVSRLVDALKHALPTVPQRIQQRRQREEQKQLCMEKKRQALKEEVETRKRMAEMEVFSAQIKKMRSMYDGNN